MGTSSEASQSEASKSVGEDSGSEFSREQSAVGRRRGWLIGGVLLVALLALASVWGYEVLNDAKRADFKSRCAAATTAEDWTLLVTVADDWRQWDPASDDALMYAAQASVGLDDFEQAAELLGRVGDSYSGALEALAFRAEIQYSNLNRPFEAEETWLRMVRLAPHANLPRQRLIYLYAMTLQREKMTRQIMEAIEWGCEPPEAYVYLVLKNVLSFSDGLAQATRWLMADPDNEMLQIAQAVYAAKQDGDQKMATFGLRTVSPGSDALLDRRLEQYPSQMELLVVKIEEAIFEGDAGQVATLFAQAGPAAERDSRFWRIRGWLMLDRGQMEQATQALQKALELNVFDWQARWLLADVLRRMGQTTRAEDVSARALAGKELQQQLFEQPNARELDEELITRMRDYFKQVAPASVQTAWDRRL